MEQQISALYQLHDEEQARRGLEARMQTHQKGMVGGRLKDMLFCLHPIDVLERQTKNTDTKTLKNTE